MKITVLGLWHLGSVTAACCARHFQVTGLDLNSDTVTGLQQGKPPILEPGLEERVKEGLSGGTLAFTTDPAEACREAEVLWVTYDTPVNDQDQSDTEAVLEPLRTCLAHLPEGALVLISSQLPVGTCRELEAAFPNHRFACSPENLRLGKAIQVFEEADRYVVGIRQESDRPLLETLFQPFTEKILFMKTESAEMVKHALNSFLAVSITYINEIACLCEHAGADAAEVSAGLKSDERIGPRAYLGAGGPFAGGTLARDVVTLSRLATEAGESLSVIPAIKQSNDHHRGWALRRLQGALGSLKGRTIAIIGLTYKPRTDTLRRSAAVELAGQLVGEGARVRAYDPVITALPPEVAKAGWQLAADLPATLKEAEALVVCTEWPEFREADWATLIASMKRPCVVDANRFLEKTLPGATKVEYWSVGRQSGTEPAGD